MDFRTELIKQNFGFNPHIIVKPYEKKINKEDLKILNELKDQISRVNFSFRWTSNLN